MPHLQPADLVGLSGFLEGLCLDDSRPAAAQRPGGAEAPIDDQQMAALLAHPFEFLASSAGAAMRAAMVRDARALERFASQQCPGSAPAFAQFAEHLGVDTHFTNFWVELLTSARHSIAAIAAHLDDDRIPLALRRAEITSLANGLAYCGERVDRELAQTSQALAAHRGDLRRQVTRVFEQRRDALITETCDRWWASTDAVVDVHVLHSVKHALGWGGNLRDDGTGYGRREAFKALILRCQHAVLRTLTPAALALHLAEECWETVRADLHQQVGATPDLAGNRQHLALLESSVRRLTTRYGPLHAGSFMTLDDDGLPVLASGPALVAIDIRQGMTHLGLATPPQDRLIKCATTRERLALHLVDHELPYVVVGDPALNERRPAGPDELARLCANVADWHREDPPSVADTLQARLATAVIAATDGAAMRRLHPGWLAAPEAARAFGERLDSEALVDWLMQLDVRALSEHHIEQVLNLVAQRPDAALAIQQLMFLRPEFPLPSGAHMSWWRKAPDDPRLALTLLLLLRHKAASLPAEALADALTPPANQAALFTPAGRAVLAQWLDLLGWIGEQGLLQPSDARRLLHPDGTLADVMLRGLHGDAALPGILHTFTRMRRSRWLPDDALGDLFTNPQPSQEDDVGVPPLFRVVIGPRNQSAAQYFDWVLQTGADAMPAPLARRLLLLDTSRAEKENLLLNVCLAGAHDTFRHYLDALTTAHARGLISQFQLSWPVQTPVVQYPAPEYLLALAIRTRAPAIVSSVMNWLTGLTAQGRMTEDVLRPVLTTPDLDGLTLLARAVRRDDVAFVAAYVDLLGVLLDRAPGLQQMDPWLLAEPSPREPFPGTVFHHPPAVGGVRPRPAEEMLRTGLWRLAEQGRLSADLLARHLPRPSPAHQ